MQSVLLRPGVDVEQTPALNEAGISQSQLIRTKNGITQTLGGWQQFGTVTVPSTVRSLHAWKDIADTNFLGIGATANLAAATSGSYRDLTPQFRDSSVAPSVSISSGSDIVQIADPNSGVSLFDTVVFHTPISIGNILLQGAYPVFSVASTGSYAVVSSVVASTTIAGGGVLPIFTTVAGSALVTVQQPNNTAAPILGIQQSFLHPTSVGGLTIEGPYNVFSVIDSTNYQIVSGTAASSADTQTMNGGLAHYHYYITTNQLIGSGGGYGSGSYGGGGYGIGSSVTGSPGTPITSTDWTQDNWGEILLSVQGDGPVFQWSPSLGFGNASIVSQAPLTNGGGFVSMPQQILVLWKSIQPQGNGGFNNGGTQDNLIVRWSDAQDFTNWNVDLTTAAGAFHIPTGSIIRGGLQSANFGVIWTDIDCWIMQFTGNPSSVFNFTKAGSGCGLVGKHAAGVISGDVYWCGDKNFFILSGNGVQVLSCTVWDFIFQGQNRDQMDKICCAPNSTFNEIAWYFCFGTATENNAYVKLNIIDKTWDYGFLSRTAWKDVSVLGPPVGSDTGAIVYQHEMGNMISGAGGSFFRSGWWTISDGQDLAFIDWIHPDFMWGTYGNNDASVQLQFFSVDYPGDTPRTYGPYTVTQANEYITPRIRGRLVSIEVISATNNVFWRLGRIRYRWAPAGRR